MVGSSLAVHSAYRHVRAACQRGVPVAILNVGETRPETEGLPVLKVEAPVVSTLAAVVLTWTDVSTKKKAVTKALVTVLPFLLALDRLLLFFWCLCNGQVEANLHG